MTYRILPTHLHIYAESVKKYFRVSQGISKFKEEEPINANASYRYTLSAESNDGHYICVEVSESAYIDTLDSEVLEYRNKAVPVKLYIAIPKDASNSNLLKQLGKARNNGVGVLEVDEEGGELIYDALSQSLAGMRPIDLSTFPGKYRATLSAAANTFRNGNPAKGCAMIYDEIEALSRRIAKKTQAINLWKSIPNLNLAKASWARVLESLMEQLNYRTCGCPKLKNVLLARVLGITGHRNQAGHKPSSRTELIRRDRQLRTRFEGACDLLSDLIDASKPLHV